MPRLIWDNTGERLYETGVKRGVLYPYDSTDPSNPYPKGVVWNGLSSVSESPSGAEANNIYADDIKYLELRSAEEFGATVEAYTYPDEFAVCDGSAEVADGVMIGQQTRQRFGFSYRSILGNDTETDSYGYKLHLIYNAMASPSERQYQTVNDSPEAIAFSWEMTTTPVAVEGYKPTASMVIDSSKADKAALAALEDVLYGTDNEEARLPLPGEVIEIMGGAVSFDISLNRANATIQVGKTLNLKATTVPAGEAVTWTSSTDTVASVSNNGVVRGLEAGSTVITASFEKEGKTYSDTCNITVEPAE